MHRHVILVGLALTTCGCDSIAQPKPTTAQKLGLYEVNGRVTIGGKPYERVQVSFHAPDGNRKSMGMSNAAGEFHLGPPLAPGTSRGDTSNRQRTFAGSMLRIALELAFELGAASRLSTPLRR